jgi:proline dehydrogenase
MGLMRSALLVASRNAWLRERATRSRFVRRAVSRFLPGEDVENALSAAAALGSQRIAAVLTQLGENISSQAEAAQVAAHYISVMDRVRAASLDAELSVKLTQLGLDLSPEVCFANLRRIIEHERAERTVWIDMEASNYVDATLELYRRARSAFPNVGVCLQAYLYRTAQDLAALLPLAPSIRLVKGAYKEPASVAFPRKRDVDENYFALARELLSESARKAGVRAAIATHDLALVRRVAEHAAAHGAGPDAYEIQMLYGIQREAQARLAGEGYRVRVLISYGSYWFPWYMRRLAERPANVWFVVRCMFAG